MNKNNLDHVRDLGLSKLTKLDRAAKTFKKIDLGLSAVDAFNKADLGLSAVDAFNKADLGLSAIDALASISARNRAAETFEKMSTPLSHGFDFSTLSAGAGLRVSALEQLSSGLNIDSVFKAAERQAASISSMISIPDTHQSLVEQIANAKADSLADTGGSIEELYGASVAELSKNVFSALSEKSAANDDKDSDPSQLVIGSALTLVSGLIDEKSANDHYFSDSIIDAEQLFSTRTDTDNDSPDEIIEAFCEWIRDYATSIKDEMTPKDVFSHVLTLICFLITMVFAWYLSK